MKKSYQVVIIGGGTAGITVAASLLLRDPALSIAVVEPASAHYYQPLWSLVGGGIFSRERSMRPMAEVMPPGVTWIRDAVAEFAPESDQITTLGGETLSYEQLVVAAGIQLDWDAIDGLSGNVGTAGICSNYSYDTVAYTWECLRNFDGGAALFTFPAGPIKCAGAPQKIMWLAEEHFRRLGVRDRTEVVYMCAAAAIFGIAKYRVALSALAEQRGIDDHYRQNLVAIRPQAKEAIFVHLDTGEEKVMHYDMIHVTPPQSAPDFIKQSPLAGDDPKGWVDVHKHTLQHNRHSNVFSLGDCSSLPCSKTGAAVRKQAPVLVENLLSARAGRPLKASYDGYASCPLVTGYGKVMLAEFGYDGVIMETFPFDQAQERYSMYALKAHALPSLYWHGMLRGRM